MKPEPVACCGMGCWSSNIFCISGGMLRMRLRMSCGLMVRSALTDTTAGVTRSATDTNALCDSSSAALEVRADFPGTRDCALSMRVQSIEDAKKTPAMNAMAPTARILDLERWIVMVGSETVVVFGWTAAE